MPQEDQDERSRRRGPGADVSAALCQRLVFAVRFRALRGSLIMEPRAGFLKKPGVQRSFVYVCQGSGGGNFFNGLESELFESHREWKSRVYTRSKVRCEQGRRIHYAGFEKRED